MVPAHRRAESTTRSAANTARIASGRVVLNREQDRLDRVEPDRRVPSRPTARVEPRRLKALAPIRRARGARAAGRRRRYHRPRCSDASRPPSPARSPVSASSTARRCWPGRTARCCSPTSAPTSSRSSRPRVTRPAAGARRGSATTAAGTRTAAYFLAVNRNKRSLRLDLDRRTGADVLRRLLADADVLVENFRAGGFARLGFDDEALRALNPRARPPRDQRLRARRPGRRPARLRLRRSRPSAG